jgi:hypothetical protein
MHHSKSECTHGGNHHSLQAKIIAKMEEADGCLDYLFIDHKSYFFTTWELAIDHLSLISCYFYAHIAAFRDDEPA